MRCNFKLLHVVPIAILVASSPSFANMAEWTRNSPPDPEPLSAQMAQTPSIQHTNPSDDIARPPQANSVQKQHQNIIAPSKPIIPQNKYSAKENTQHVEATPTVVFSGLENGAALSQYMQQSQAITRQANLEATRMRLTAKSQGALNVYTANLMSIGVDTISGDDPRDSLRSYNQSVGCINGLQDPNLIAIAKNALASTIRTVDIRKVVSGAFVLGSTMTTQCVGS